MHAQVCHPQGLCHPQCFRCKWDYEFSKGRKCIHSCEGQNSWNVPLGHCCPQIPFLLISATQSPSFSFTQTKTFTRMDFSVAPDFPNVSRHDFIPTLETSRFKQWTLSSVTMETLNSSQTRAQKLHFARKEMLRSHRESSCFVKRKYNRSLHHYQSRMPGHFLISYPLS